MASSVQQQHHQRKWPQTLALATAAALILANGASANDQKKPEHKPTPSHPAARPSAPAGGGAGGGANHPQPQARPSNPTPSQAAPRAGGGNPNPGGGERPAVRSGGSRENGGGAQAPRVERPQTQGGGFGNRSGSGAPPTHNGGVAGGGGMREGGMREGGARPGGGMRNEGGGVRAGSGNGHIPYSPGAGHTVQRAGREVAVRNNGRPSEIHSRDMMIRRGPQGTAIRRTVVERNGRVYAFNRAGNGHISRSYAYGGRTYVVRNYYVGGRSFPRFYRSYGYRGVFFDAYAPAVYYSPYYYGWAYRPWAAPVVFSWGWGRSPWYGYYGGYFTPYPAYPSANLWLTDYMVSQTLEASYRERVESARAANMQYNDQPPQQYQAQLTPEIKQQIAEEVQRQLSYEGAEAQQRQQPQQQQGAAEDPGYTGVGRMIEDNKTHVLLSNANIDVTTLNGQECSISQGDAIAITPGQGGSQGETVQVKVLASAAATGGCPSNSVVSISLQDLQEMVNHVRATIDSGLAAMQKDSNLPKPPSSVPTAAVQAEFASAAPPADPNEAAELQRLNQEASQTEQTVLKEASYNDPGVPSGSNPPPAQGSPSTELQPGMTTDDVIRIMGAPTGNTKFGGKQIMTYPNVKLTFTNGKLTDIQ